MVISIEFFGIQRVIAKTNIVSMPINGKTIVSDVIEYVRNKYPALYLDGDTLLITVNHEAAPPDRLLRANDTVSFIPRIGGG
ncbi:MAG: MoaD/ThiS family protein [Dehalococcoidia bacterium]|nr:MoaD/ThiS family protein [Dehalococcoidia bacterium]